MLRYDALLIAQPRSQPGMLQDHAVPARAFCAAGLDACSILLTRLRRGPAVVKCIAILRSPIECSYGALPCAAYPPSSGTFTSSHLVNLPVVSRLEVFVCFGIASFS